MTGWRPKRFWTDVRFEPRTDGFCVMLDGRILRTPAKADLVLPTVALAEAVAAEWSAQGETINPMTMPATRAANTAIDTVTPKRVEIAAIVAAYGESDLLCYRAEAPEALFRRQADSWDPLLGWADGRYGARLVTGRGIVHVSQPPVAIAALRARVLAFDPWGLTALHDLVSLTGSLVLGLAASEGGQLPETIWDASRIDETWQQEQWGIDEESVAVAAARRTDFLRAAQFWMLSRP
jgi:chaperone required for assembly of F1-ATPase